MSAPTAPAPMVEDAPTSGSSPAAGSASRTRRGRHGSARRARDRRELARPLALRRFRIQGKLNTLLVLALAAVLLVAVPFVANQIRNARSSATTAGAARDARALGGLIWELQRERLLTTEYLAVPTTPNTELAQQQGTVDRVAADVQATLGPDTSDELAASLVRLGSLREPRESALRGISPDRVARTYHAVIDALIDALRLVPQNTGDAEGTRQLAALDALLRANEFSALREMSLIAAAVNPQTGLPLLSDSSARAPLLVEQFVQQADPGPAGLVVQVDQSEGARRVEALATELTGAPQRPRPSFVGDTIGQVDAQLTARRAVQDQVTGQIADAAGNRASRAATFTVLIGISAAVLLGLVAALAIAVSRSIAVPLRRLTTAAAGVADLASTELARITTGERSDEQVPHLPPIHVTTADELGELAAVFNRVQSTAVGLVEQHVIRRNNDVSVMFANVAQRTQNLVGRQLALIDELERNEQDGRLLAGLYRLDHLSTRLRRTADDLLVVAGSEGEGRIQGPVGLTVALRSALAEIEDYQRVELDDRDEVTLSAAFGSDAVLLFAELLDNATAFSPPESVVEVTTEFPADGSCLVRIVDHGIGMPDEHLAEENRRLGERERLPMTPTGVLGLFVVGQLARRHSLGVQLVETPTGGITARVSIPAQLYSRVSVTTVQPTTTGPRPPAPGPRPPQPELVIPPAEHSDGFAWFPTAFPDATVASPTVASPTVASPTVASPTAALPLSTPDPAPTDRGGLQRRVPGAKLADAAVPPRTGAAQDRSHHNAAAVREDLDGYQAAFSRAAEVSGLSPPRDTAPGLSRRVPGASLAPGLRPASSPDRAERPVPGARQRNPDAELAAFDGFAAGFARAGQATPPADLAPAPTATDRTVIPRPRRAQHPEPTSGRDA